jgi:hypothetical protein
LQEQVPRVDEALSRPNGMAVERRVGSLYFTPEECWRREFLES